MFYAYAFTWQVYICINENEMLMSTYRKTLISGVCVYFCVFNRNRTEKLTSIFYERRTMNSPSFPSEIVAREATIL